MLGDLEGIDSECEWSACVHGVADVVSGVLIA